MKAEYFIGASASKVKPKDGTVGFEIHFGENGYISIEGGHDIPVGITGQCLLTVTISENRTDLTFGRVAVEHDGEATVLDAATYSYLTTAVTVYHSLYAALIEQEPTLIPPDPAEASESLLAESGA